MQTINSTRPCALTLPRSAVAPLRNTFSGSRPAQRILPKKLQVNAQAVEGKNARNIFRWVEEIGGGWLAHI